MKTRTLLVISVAAAVTGLPFIVSSADNPAHARAHSDLRIQLASLNEPAAGGSTAQTESAAALGPREDTEAQGRARKAVREEVTVLAAADMSDSRDPAALSSADGPRDDTEAQATARKQVRLVTRPARTVATPNRSHSVTRGMIPPKSPFTEAQQSALAELLNSYLAGQISSKDYHQKRAAIVAGT